MAVVKIDISVGEAVDRISILEIKKRKITEPSKLENVKKEYNLLLKTISRMPFGDEIFDDADYLKLYKVNKELWDVEDGLRYKEQKKVFDKQFIELARKVYELNDKRAQIKKKININYKSDLIEEKSYGNC